MRFLAGFLILSTFLPAISHATKSNALNIIANEPVTMMDIGIIKMNANLSRPQRGLHGATIGARFNARKGTIDIKVSMPVKKASKSQCKNIINNTKKIFVKTRGKKKVSNIHHYFQHEGTGYTRRINWDNVAKHVVITGIALTKKNFRESVFCQSQLMNDKVTY
ncbi:MAG: hypothetical protein P8Y24_08190 [Gammaproteobacteria bacterium]|jgi:hypothetical protein